MSGESTVKENMSSDSQA